MSRYKAAVITPRGVIESRSAAVQSTLPKPKVSKAVKPQLLYTDRLGCSVSFLENSKRPYGEYCINYPTGAVFGTEDLPFQQGDPSQEINGVSETLMLAALRHKLQRATDNPYKTAAALYLTQAIELLDRADRVAQQNPSSDICAHDTLQILNQQTSETNTLINQLSMSITQVDSHDLAMLNERLQP